MEKTFATLSMLMLLTSFAFSAVLVKQANCSEPPEMEWSKTFGGTSEDREGFLVQVGDGGYAVAGSTKSYGAGGSDFWLVRTDSSGNMLWNRTYGGTSDDYVRYVISTSDGGYAIVGFTRSQNFDVLFVKTDTQGNMEWSRTYGGSGFDQAYAIVETTDGGFALAAFTDSKGAGNRDFWLIRTDSSGTLLWDQTYGGVNDDTATAMVQTSTGEFVILGYTKSFGAGDADYWLVVTDSDGNMLWNRTYGGLGEEIGLALTTSDDGYALVGTATDSGLAGRDLWLIVADVDGNIIFNERYGGSNYEESHSIIVTSEGGYAISGTTASFGAGGDDFWVIKTDAEGQVQWNQTYGGVRNEWAFSIVQASDGGYVVAGCTFSFGAGNADLWLIKLASPLIQATIDVDPNSLNLRSPGLWITVYIELPEGYDVNNIDVSTLMLNNTISVDLDAPSAISDYDEDGTLDLMVKFSRSEVIDFIITVLGTPSKFTSVTLTVTGELSDGTVFEGSDTIRIIYASARGAGRHTLFR